MFTVCPILHRAMKTDTNETLVDIQSSKINGETVSGQLI